MDGSFLHFLCPRRSSCQCGCWIRAFVTDFHYHKCSPLCTHTHTHGDCAKMRHRHCRCLISMVVNTIVQDIVIAFSPGEMVLTYKPYLRIRITNLTDLPKQFDDTTRRNRQQWIHLVGLFVWPPSTTMDISTDSLRRFRRNASCV